MQKWQASRAPTNAPTKPPIPETTAKRSCGSCWTLLSGFTSPGLVPVGGGGGGGGGGGVLLESCSFVMVHLP
jgi:hypothetical protein